jgi:hypothetical protein
MGEFKKLGGNIAVVIVSRVMRMRGADMGEKKTLTMINT